jgi:hypothetical protein
VVQVTVRGVRELKGAHANVVQSLVVDTEGLIGVLNELVNGEGSVVRLNDSVGNLGGGNNGEGRHHTVGELLTDLGDQKSTHTGTGTTTERVGDLEALEAVTAFSLTTDDIDNLVDQLGALGVVTLGPVVSGTGLSEDEVVWSEELSVRSSSDRVHSSWLEIHEDGSWYVSTAGGFVVVDVDSL